MSYKRILAVVLRHYFLIKRDLARLTDIVWFPVIDLVIWGLVTNFLTKTNNAFVNQALSFFLGGIILWVFVYRMQQDMSLSLLIDIWDRNILNLLTSPLTVGEYLIGLTITGFIRLLITMFILVILAFFLYSFNLFSLGFYLIPFAANLLLMGWWMGTVLNGILLRFGYRMEALGWGFVYIFNPLSGVFFPLAAMPRAMQLVARLLPSSYIFEGMRQVLITGKMNVSDLAISFALNVFYGIWALVFYFFMVKKSLRSGALAKFF